SRSAASTVTGELQSVLLPSVLLARTLTSRRSRDSSGANGHWTKTESPESTATTSSPERSSYSFCSHPSPFSTVHESRGRDVPTIAKPYSVRSRAIRGSDDRLSVTPAPAGFESRRVDVTCSVIGSWSLLAWIEESQRIEELFDRVMELDCLRGPLMPQPSGLGH